MPSPSIPRSLSDLNFGKSHQQLPTPPHRRSSLSDGSTITKWPKKVTTYIASRRSSSSSKNSELTQETLAEFNRRNNNIPSPYYKGLTDSTLILNRLKLTPLSPERESIATSFGSTTTKSSFVLRVQEWGISSCFSFKNREQKNAASAAMAKGFADNNNNNNPQPITSLSGLLASGNRGGATGTKTKRVRIIDREKDSTHSLDKGKSLRERTSEPQPPSSLSPAPPSLPEQEEPSLQTSPLPETSEPPLTSLPPTPLTETSVLPLVPLPPEQTPARPLSPLEETSESSSPLEESLAACALPSTSLPDPESLSAREVVLNDKEERKAEDNEREFVWADKYRPDALKNFICNKNKALELRDLAKAENCGHFIFVGPPGVGKRTMICAFIHETYGLGEIQATQKCKEFVLKGEEEGSIQVNLKESSQLVEVNLSELKGYEKYIIVELINDKNNRLSNKALQVNHDHCRAIILNEADKLSTDSLLYIRWLLERYKGCNKVFFCCSDVSKLEPIQSICTIVELLPPSTEEILEVLQFIAKKEDINLPLQLAKRIANNSKNNLRQGIRSFEATWHHNSILTGNQELMTGWEDDIANIAKNIVEEQSPKQLYIVRGKLQNLIEHNVSPEFIFETLFENLKMHLHERLWPQLEHLYEDYNRDDDSERPFPFGRHRQEEVSKRQNDPMRKNVQHFMRIEEFIAKFMSWYKTKQQKHLT